MSPRQDEGKIKNSLKIRQSKYLGMRKHQKLHSQRRIQEQTKTGASLQLFSSESVIFLSSV